MIIVTRLNGTEIVVNADLIETIEATPDTVVTLVDGTRYLVEENPTTIIERVMGLPGRGPSPRRRTDRGHRRRDRARPRDPKPRSWRCTREARTDRWIH